MAKEKAAKSNKKGAKLHLGMVIVAIVLIVAIVVLGIVYKDNIVTLFEKPAPSDAIQNTGTSVLGGKPAVAMPVEIGEVGLEVHFIDVGQGDAIVIRLPDGKDIVVDAGSGTSEKKEVTQKYLDYLQSIKIDEIDYLIATHAHSDHMNMLDNVLENYKVSNIYYNGYDQAPTTAYYKAFEEKVASEGANVVKFDNDGEIYHINSAKEAAKAYSVTIYAPGYARYSDTNYMSPFITVEYAGRKVLLTGDAEEESEKWFMETVGGAALDVDVLKVGHHGSTKGTSVPFLNYITTEYAVISVGEENTYNHPTPFTMNDLYNKGVVTYRTNRQGNIVMYVDNEGDFGFGVSRVCPIENNKNSIKVLMIIPQK